MTSSGLFFIFFEAIIAIAISYRKTLQSTVLPWALFLYHLLFSIIYWNYSLSRPADSVTYYRSIGDINKFGPGTNFIKWLINFFDYFFTASYLDYFLLFQLFGYLGLCLLYNTFLELQPLGVSKRGKKIMWLFLFMPNLHFWTCAIGKDSLIFFGITLAIWGLVKYQTRIYSIVLGLFIMYLVRPHVAGIFILAILLALLWGRGLTLRWRILITVLSISAIVVILPRITDFVGIEEISTESVSSYLQKRQGYNLEGGSSVDIRSYNLPLKIFTFLFRPFFVDARGLLGMLVSIENVIYIFFAFLSTSRNLWSLLWKYRISFFMRFNFFFFIVGVMLFSLSISNMGIAIRQKTMLLPSFMILVISVIALKEYQSKSKTVQDNSDQMEPLVDVGAYGVLPNEHRTVV